LRFAAESESIAEENESVFFSVDLPLLGAVTPAKGIDRKKT
jgi:hypothetical protein